MQKHHCYLLSMRIFAKISNQLFLNLFRNLDENDSFRPKLDNLDRPKIITADQEDEIHIENDLQTSSR